MLGCVAPTFAATPQDFERIAPKLPPPLSAEGTRIAPAAADEAPVTGDSTRVLVKKLRGIVLVPAKENVREAGMKAEGVQFRGVEPPEREALERQLAWRIGRPLSLASINRISIAINAFYRSHDHPIVDVVVPAQDITSGTLQLIVIEGKLGTVKAEGNKWFESSFLESQIRTKPGESISGRRLEQDLDWLNANPFRRVNLVYEPGGEPGTTDLILRTTDRRPFRVYVGYEDTGNDLTGDERWLAGFNWGNAFGVDHQFNYQFTASSDFESLRAHAGSYVIPLPWRHTLTFFGGYAESSVDTEVGGALFHLDGSSIQAGFRYAIPLPSLGRVTHNVTFGFDFKETDSNLFFGGDEVFGTPTHIFQGVAAYHAALKDRLGATSFRASLYGSTGGWNSRNSDEAFESQRAGASSEYIYGQLGLDRVTRLPAEFSLVTRALWQWSDGNLLASEQLGLGGFNTVRGYEESEVRGDGGVLLSAELRTPPLHPLQKVGLPATSDELQFLAFFDYGVATLHDALPGEDDSVSLVGTGIGLRYAFNPFVSIRFDWGWQLKDTGFNDRFDNRAHLGVVLCY